MDKIIIKFTYLILNLSRTYIIFNYAPFNSENNQNGSSHYHKPIYKIILFGKKKDEDFEK